jgi:hypothetical protein
MRWSAWTWLSSAMSYAGGSVLAVTSAVRVARVLGAKGGAVVEGSDSKVVLRISEASPQAAGSGEIAAGRRERPNTRFIVYDHEIVGDRAWFRLALNWTDPSTGETRTRAGMQLYRVGGGKLAETWLPLQKMGSALPEATGQEHGTSIRESRSWDGRALMIDPGDPCRPRRAAAERHARTEIAATSCTAACVGRTMPACPCLLSRGRAPSSFCLALATRVPSTGNRSGSARSRSLGV